LAAGSPLLKIKWTHRQEFAIAGYVPLLGTRIGEVGGLILALKSPDGAFHFAGKVGTGFTSAMRAKLGKLLEADHVDKSPLVDAPRLRGARWSGLKHVAEVEFIEWTSASELRHPSFQGSVALPVDLCQIRRAPEATMSPQEQAEKASAFRALHERDRAFVTPNPWDIASARVLEALGFEALATTSSGLAISMGQSDGEPGRDAILDHAAAVVRATHLPVTGDLENGFGDRPEDVAETIRAAASAGLVGGSIEDFTGRPEGPLYDVSHAKERVAAGVEAARGLDFPFTLTARAENFFRIPIIQRLLVSPAEHQRMLGWRVAMRVHREYDGQLAATLVEAWQSYRDHYSTYDLVLKNRDPRMTPLLMDGLSGVDARRTSTFAYQLAESAVSAQAALPRLAEIAASHWDHDTRAAAASAYNRISGRETIRPGPDHCPIAVRRESSPPGARWKVQLATRTLELSELSVSDGARERHHGKCGDSKGLALEVGKECLVARQGFECQGRLEVWRDGGKRYLGTASPAGFVERDGDVLFFEACLHGVGAWSVASLVRGPSGTWKRRNLASVSGAHLVAFLVEPTGSIDLLVDHPDGLRDGKWHWPCETERVEGIGSNDRWEGVERTYPREPIYSYLVLRIDADGSVKQLA
jgi:hypothetical protein